MNSGITGWQLGRDILERQGREGWGAKVIERLANDLRREFPDMKGFSRANLMYMRSFAEAWDSEEIVQRLVGQIPWGQNIYPHTHVALYDKSKGMLIFTQTNVSKIELPENKKAQNK